MKLACLTGRFQPVHQHLELFGLALAACDLLAVAITTADSGAPSHQESGARSPRLSHEPVQLRDAGPLIGAALADVGLAKRATIADVNPTRPKYGPLVAHQFVRASGSWGCEGARRLREVGDTVTLVDCDSATKLLSSKVRRCAGDSWHEAVAVAKVPLLRWLLERKPMAARQSQ